jgi:hypothetical protein
MHSRGGRWPRHQITRSHSASRDELFCDGQLVGHSTGVFAQRPVAVDRGATLASYQTPAHKQPQRIDIDASQ